MTDKPPAMPELPEPELGYIETDKSKQPAFSARQMRVALQSAQPAAASDDDILTAGHRTAWRYKHSTDPAHSSTYTFNRACLLQFARALAQRPAAQAGCNHVLYETTDADRPKEICDQNGEVVLAMCKLCRKAEVELEDAQQATPEPLGDAPIWNSIQIASWIGSQLMHEPTMFERATVCKFVRALGRHPTLLKHSPKDHVPAPGVPVGEVAATVAEVHMGRYTLEWNGKPYPEGTKLYTRPAPGLPEDVLAILDECRNALMECDRDGDYALIDRIDALAAAQAKGADK